MQECLKECVGYMDEQCQKADGGAVIDISLLMGNLCFVYVFFSPLPHIPLLEIRTLTTKRISKPQLPWVAPCISSKTTTL